MIRAQFTMPLYESSKLLVGKFELIDSEIILNDPDPAKQLWKHSLLKTYPATSGLAGYQTEDHFWTRRKGPIPRTIKGKREYKFSVKDRYHLDTRGVEGLFYHIRPDPILQIGGPGQRTEVGIHRDANVPGTSACVGLILSVSEYKDFNDYIWSIAKDVTDMPLDVTYIMDRKTA